MHDGRDGVEEGEGLLPGQGADGLGQGRRGERAGRENRRAPARRREALDLAALEPDERLGGKPLGHLGGEALPVDGERAAGRQLVAVGGGEDQGAAAPHLLMQQAHGIARGIVGPEGVGADQLRQPVGAMGLGRAQGTHLVQDDRQAGPCELPGRLAAGEPPAHDMDRIVLHRANR